MLKIHKSGALRRAIMGLGVSAVALLASGCVPHTVGSTEVGIRVNKLGIIGNKGVVQRPYRPGTHFFMPLINDWYLLDTRIQNLEMTFDPGRGDVRMRDDLLFKTIDGNDISLDVIIAYRIDPNKAPTILQYVGESNEQIKRNIIRTIARSKPRDIFGELKTEEFYVSAKRSEKAMRARDVLNSLLNPYGIIVENVLTKDYRFNQAYQKAIEDKKVADQQVQKNISATNAAREEYKKKLQDAVGEVNRMIAQSDGDFTQAKIEVDAYYEQQQRIAKAIEAEGQAEAEAIRNMNQALASAGGVTMVKLKIAESLKGKRILIMPFTDGGFDIKSTNVNDLIDVYGTKSLSSKQ